MQFLPEELEEFSALQVRFLYCDIPLYFIYITLYTKAKQKHSITLNY